MADPHHSPAPDHDHGHGHGQSHGPTHGSWSDVDWAAILHSLVIEGETLLPLLDETLDRIAAMSDHPVARIVDIGCGPGVATTRMAQRIPAATVTGVDGSAAMLERATERAADLGLSGRVAFEESNLDDPMDASGDVDLMWASMVLHHIGNEAALLTKLAGRLAPGGVLAIVEFGDPLRYLPDDETGLDGLQARFDAAGEAWLATMRAGLPGTTASADYPAMLAAAGLDVIDDRIVTTRFDAPLSPDHRRVILGQLRQRRQLFAERADAADQAELDVLLDPDDPRGIMQRDDVFLEISRRVIVGLRPR